jgi:alanine dehydrogenase
MKIAVPKEIKPLEGRVALLPEACGELARRGHEVLIQAGAGLASGWRDEEYTRYGAQVLPDPRAIYEMGELILKVKEPWEREPEWLHEGQTLFCFLHLAAAPGLARRLLQSRVTAVAFETVQEEDGRLPILAPMSEIAGRLAVQVGAGLLHAPQGGKGLLLGGLATAERGRVTVIGAGNAGSSAVRTAAALGAEVLVFDQDLDRLRGLHQLGPNVTALYPYADSLAEAVVRSDLLIGAVLLPGARAPRVVSAEQVTAMAPGSVVVDISVDQGGCIETIRPTTYKAPTYRVNGVTHFAVTNMPGAVPRSASRALCAALMPYLLRLAEAGWEDVPALSRGVNLAHGRLRHPALHSPGDVTTAR